MEIDNSKNANLTLVYKTEKGEEFYSYVDPLQISTPRGISAEKAKRFLDLNLTERALKELIAQCKYEASTGDLVKAFSVIQEIEYRLNFIAEETSILDLVCIYFFLKNEDPEIPSEALNKVKQKIFAEDIKCKGFFLQIGLVLCKKFSEKQEGDILSYLEENKAMSDRIRRFIPEEYLINSMSGSTH